MARFTPLTCAPTNVSANSIATSQTPAGAGDLTLDGATVTTGVATLGAAQLVTITSGSNISNRTLTVYGTGPTGETITEAITGPNNTTVTGTKYFKTITRIAISGAAAGALTVGHAITAVSAGIVVPQTLNNPFNIGIGCVISGTITYSVQVCYDDPGTAYASLNWFEHGTITAKSANTDSSTTAPVTALRLRVTASTSGTVTGNFIQAGQ